MARKDPRGLEDERLLKPRWGSKGRRSPCFTRAKKGKEEEMMKKKMLVGWVLVTVLLFLLGPPALAQEKFPSRPVSWIIPWSPGGGGTLNAQAIQVPFEKALGGSVQIINKPGGGGTIAWNFVANSPPDGYTIVTINPSTVVTPYTTKTGVPLDRFDPIIYTVGIPAGVVVRDDSPWKTFKEFITYAKANPEKVQMANSGFAAMYHIGIIGIQMATGVKFTNVPYKGSGPCVTALLGGHADSSLIEIGTLLPYVEAKKLRVLAVSSAKRNADLPDVPTFKEHGFDLDVGTWYAYAVPRGTPKDRIQTLHNAFKVAMKSKPFQDFYKGKGGVIEYKNPKGVIAFVKEQDKLWKKIIDFGGFKPGG